MSEQDAARLSALRGYGVLDTPNEPKFDELVKEAAYYFEAPVALVSLVDENRQWFKAKVGVEPNETPLTISFCTHAIRGPEVFVVEDAASDPRFANYEIVTGDPHVRFYAGAPLRTPEGQRIGTLCILDVKPRKPLTPKETARLERLADRVMMLMEERRANRN